MASEKRLIDANALKHFVCETCNAVNSDEPCEPSDCRCMQLIDEMPTVDAVSRGVHDQVRWERDIAIGQLEEHGISFGCVAPDVVKVVRCKDCKHGIWDEDEGLWKCVYDADFDEQYGEYFGFVEYNDGLHFCSYGERKDNERKVY